MAFEPLARAGARMARYLERHAQTCVASIGRLVRQPLATALTIGVIGAALAVPACLYVLVQNARGLAGAYEGAFDLAVYLKPGEPERAAQTLAADLRSRIDVESTRVVTAAEGLAEFREWSGLGPSLDALKENPLPHAVIVRPRVTQADSAAVVERLQALLKARPGIDQVVVDANWVRRFVAILDLVRRALGILALVLGGTVLVVVGNTIRVDIDARRPEIEVTKLVGGSDAFVRRPFLYGGLWYGLGGGLVAWLVVATVIFGVSGPVGRVAAAYGSSFRLQGLDTRAALVLVLGGALLGWLGAYAAATRHLRRIEPAMDH